MSAVTPIATAKAHALIYVAMCQIGDIRLSRSTAYFVLAA